MMQRYFRSLLCAAILSIGLFYVNNAAAQSCTGSLGDPIFKETFGDAGTTVKPTLGPALPAGITNYTYYNPATASRPVGPYPGQYAISNTTRGYNNTYFVDRPDHTKPGTGYCMVVDADATPGLFYQRTITGLCAGTTFEFSAWIMNINPQNGVSQPSLRFQIVDANNPSVEITSISTGQVPFQNPGTWVRQAGVFQMPSTTSSVILRIYSNTPSSNGNDLALDDIAFAACGPPITFTQGAGTVCKGGNTSVTVTLPAGSYSNYYFQLQNRLVGATNWNDVGGVVNNGANNSYTFPITNAQGGYEYRVVAAGGTAEINNVNCRVTSNALPLQVVDFTPVISGPAAICYNTGATLTATINPVGTGTPASGFVYTWESSPNGTSNWTTIAGQTTATLNTGNLTATTYYRVTATVNGCSGSGASQVYPVTVYPQITATIAPPNHVCQGSAAFPLFYALTSGSASLYYISSTDMPGFTNVSGATLGASPITVIIPANVPAGTYHFNIIFTNPTIDCASPSYPVTLTIDGAPSTPNAGNDTTLCNVSSMNMAATPAAVGQGTWFAVSGPSTPVFTAVHDPHTQVTGLVPGNYVFAWDIQNGVCNGVGDQINVTILNAPTTANAGPDQLQYNSGVFLMNANAPSSGTGSWTVIAGNATLSNPTSPATNATIAANTSATLVWTITNGICPPSRDTVVITYTSAADIQIQKTIQESGPYIAGQDFIYEIVTTNAGPSNATAVHITDPLPATFIATSVQVAVSGGAILISNNSSLTNIDVTADIPTGAAQVKVVVVGKLSSALNGNITNTATAVSPNVPDTSGATSTVTVPVIRRPYFDLLKTAPATGIAGGPITFGVTVNNTGLGDAQNATITDVISPMVSNVSWTAVATGKNTIVSGATGTGNNISMVVNAPAGDTGKIYITINGTITAAATGTIMNQAVATASEVAVGSFTSNTTNTVINSSLGLVLVKSHANPVVMVSGNQVTYQIGLVNNGPSNAVGTVILDTIPATILNPVWTATANGTSTITGGATGTGSIVRVTANIPAGSSNNIVVSVTGTVNPDFKGTLVNTVHAIPAEPGVSPIQAQDVATVAKTVKVDVVKNGPATATAGSQISYTLDVTNEGPSNSDGSVITDQVPAALTNVSWTASVTSGTASISAGATGTGNNVNITTLMNAGSSIRVIINGTLLSSATGSITNHAVVTPLAPNTVPVTSNNVVTTITNQTKLNIVKSGPDTAQAGGLINYALFITNSGPSDAHGLTISDVVPSQVTNVRWTAGASNHGAINSGNTGTGNNIVINADLPAGNANAIAVVITGNVAPGFSGAITNKAVVTPAEAGSVGDSSSKTTYIKRLPQLTITKTAVDRAVAGDSLTYTITVGNVGISDAVGVSITDTIPADILGAHWTATTTGNAVISLGTTGVGSLVNISANIPAGANNTVVITVKGKTNPDVSMNVVNTAHATPSEPVPSVSASKTVIVRKMPVLTITKSGPAQLAAGEKIAYTVIVTNTGLSNASNLLISDAIPTQVQNPSWTATATGAAQVLSGATGSGNNLSADVNLPAGAGNSIVINITGMVDPAFSGSFLNAAVTIPSEPGATPVASDPVTTIVSQQPNVRITKSGPSVANAGETVTYILNVRNLGPSNTKNTLITDQVPAGLQNPTWTAIAAGRATITSGASGTGQLVTVTADIPADSSGVQITVRGTLPSNTTDTVLKNVAVAAPAESGIPPVHSDTIVTVINKKPGLLITKSGPTTAIAGSTLLYGLRITNVGPSDAKGAIIRDTVPATATVVRWGAVAAGAANITSGANGTGNIINIVADIPAGTTNTVIVLVETKVQQDYVGNIVNTAHLWPAEPGADSSSSTVTTAISRRATLEIRKTAPATIVAGNNIQYTVEVVNHGPSSTHDVTIKDNIPAGILNATWTAVATNGAVIKSGNTGTGNILLTADITNDPTAKITITISGQVSPAFTGTSIQNTASVLNPSDIGPSGDTAVVNTTVTREADLRIIKSGAANQAAGEATDYQLQIVNLGPSNATGVTIADILPAGILNATWTATATGNVANMSPASGTGNVNITADIPGDGSSAVTVNISGITSPASVNGATITNTATVALPAGSGVTDPVLSNNTSTVSATVDNDPVVRIAKSGPATAEVGDTIRYRVVISNGGSGNITGALIEDNVPSTVSVFSWTASGTGTAAVTGATSGTTNTVSTTGDIPVGSGNTIVLMIDGVVTESVGTLIVNTAAVTAGTHKESSVTTTVNNSADIRVQKSGPATAAAGQGISYTLQVYNNGPRSANHIRIQDVIPAAVNSVTWSAIATGNATIMGSARVDSSGNVIDMPATIAAGSGNYITFQVTGIIDGATTVTSILNSLAAADSVRVDVNPLNNLSTITTTITKQTSVTVQKSGPQQAVAGNTIAYTLTVGNNGPSDAIGLNIRDAIPAAILNPSWTVLVQGGASVTGPFSGTGNVNTTVNIPGGADNLVAVAVTGSIDPNTVGDITNVVLAGNTTIPDVSDTLVTHVSRLTRLDIRKTGPATITAGDYLTYTISVTNNGPSDALGMQITDTIDSRLSNVTWTATATPGATVSSGSSGTGPHILVGGNITAAGNGTILITVNGMVAPSATGTIVNTATVTPGDTSNKPVVSNVVNTVIMSRPVLTIRKSAPSSADAGELIAYQLVVSNIGLSKAVNAVISDNIPASLQQVTWTTQTLDTGAVIHGATSGSGNAISLTADLQPNSSLVVNITGKVDSSFAGNIVNTAIVQPSETGVTGDTSTVTTNVNLNPGLQILKTGPSAILSGQQINYVITVTNAGPSNATNAAIRDIVPAGVQNVSWTVQSNGQATFQGSSTGTGNVNLTASIPPGAGNSVVVNVNGTVSPSFRDTLTNLATVTSAETGKIDTSIVKTGVTARPVLSILKSGPASAVAGQPIAYRIAITNTSISDASNFSVADVVPAAITNVTWTATTAGTAVISSPASGTGNNITLTGNMPTGAGNSIVILVNGMVGPTVSGNITNTATVTPSEPNTVAQTSTVNTVVVIDANLTVSKTGPANMYRGATATYVINVGNTGQSAAINTLITDSIPSALTNVTWTATPKGTATISAGATGSGNMVSVTATIPGVDSSSVQIVVTGTVRSDAADGTVINIASANFNGTVNSAPVFSVIGSQADVAIGKYGTQQVYVGQKVTYELFLANGGPSAANGTTAQDMLPAIGNPVVTSVRTANGAAAVTTSITNNTLNATVGTFPPQAAVFIDIEGTALEPGVLNNTATITAPPGVTDPDLSNNISNTVVTTVIPKAELDITKSVSPGPYSVGQQVTYSLTVKNNGVEGVNPVVVTDSLPSPALLGNITYSNPPRGTVSVNGQNLLTWNIGLLNAGESITWSYTGTITGKGDIRNVAYVTGPPEVSVPDTAVVDINSGRYANLKVVKQLNTVTGIEVGKMLEFVITAANQGPDTATGVVMTDEIQRMLGDPTGIIASRGAAVYDNSTRTITWTIPFMAPGNVETVTFSARLISSDTIINTAVISGNETDLDPSDNTSTVTKNPGTPDDDLFIPNVVTPDGDGKNDNFVIPGIDKYPGSTLLIYNRWGNQVYQNKNYNNTWNGKDLNEGTYFYILKLNKGDVHVRDIKGWILLIR
ncbi:gliding motility-associated C-terminal domain-containing protein [Chitinophaga sp. Cy-1792]|uniref:T9SS type B sorting domain-containing protein n=1 Tax=Chitinophaga sp. Cy-1792 TaxID=2608339 RepID=UPI001424310E|nr:gliding motility-associated C-terminal domain-containing protein [Chitinophaga sp. Cy-1792]